VKPTYAHKITEVSEMSWKDSGVNDAPEAGGQGTGFDVDKITLEDLGFETGEDDAGEADQGAQDDLGDDPMQEDSAVSGQDEQGEQFNDTKQEKAWAKRIAAEREKIRREVDAEYQQKTAALQNAQQSYQQPQKRTWVEPQPLTKDELEKLADSYAMTTDAVQVMYSQQVELNRMKYLLEQSFTAINAMKDDTTKGDAMAQIERNRKSNPYLPAFDEGKVSAIRQRHYQQHGITLPWHDAYKQLVADEAMSGNLSRQAQQKAIKQITSRNRTNVQAGNAAQAKQVNMEDLSDDQFERLKERVKAGALTRGK